MLGLADFDKKISNGGMGKPIFHPIFFSSGSISHAPSKLYGMNHISALDYSHQKTNPHFPWAQ
jgi:hypothetical protein